MTNPPPASAPGPGPIARTTISRDLADFLIELSIALNKFSMYPDGHPSLQPAAAGLGHRLETLLTERGTLSVGVARQQLVIEGVATDAKNPVLTDLASRLHRHHLGAITFARGVEAQEVVEFLRQVAADADRSGQPLGLTIQTRIAAWAHIRLYPLMYDRLELLDEAAEQPASDDPNARTQRTRAAQLWIGMARSALAAGEPDKASGATAGAQEGPTDPSSVARAIEGHPRGTAYDQVIVGYMLQIAEELRAAGGAEAVQLRQRMSRLVSTLEPSTLGRLLDMGGDGMQRRKFLLNASQGMAVDAVLDLVRAASQTEEQTVSHSMLRMLQKLARHADAGHGDRRALAEESVRVQVAELVQGWSLKDPNPEAYRATLEALSAADPLFAVSPDARYAPESKRVVELALEANVFGESVARAASALADQGDLRWLVEILARAAPSPVTEECWRLVATPQRLTAVLRAEPVDPLLVDALVPRMGAPAAGLMLDALADLQAAQGRRLLLDRIVKLGASVAAAAIDRLGDTRWYVQRNLLKILADLSVPGSKFRAADFLQHNDARVRREALRALLNDPALRERALCRALGDPDERLVRAALTAALRDCPAAALPLVVSRALTGTTEDQRVTAIRVLGTSGQRAALEPLLRLAAPKKTLFGTKPRSKTAEYLASLSALRAFGGDPRARAILDAAARSKDGDVSRAASATPSP